MILTGKSIEAEVGAGRIHIEPFTAVQLNPNSYDFRLGDSIVEYTTTILDAKRENPTRSYRIPEDGVVLRPGKIFLGHTLEVMGSKHHVPIIRAKSSTARLGLFVHVTADLIDIGSINQWTLQLYPVQPVRLYAGMRIGQVTFWSVSGEVQLYTGKYQGSRGPQPSQSYKEFSPPRRVNEE